LITEGSLVKVDQLV